MVKNITYCQDIGKEPQRAIDGTLHLNIDDDLYAKAQEVAQSMGLDLETSIRLFLVQMVREQGLPFTPKAHPVRKSQRTVLKQKLDTRIPQKTTTANIREYIRAKILQAQRNGNKEIIIVSGEVHKEMGLDNQMPMVCGAMKSIDGFISELLQTTPSGKSSTIKMRFLL